MCLVSPRLIDQHTSSQGRDASLIHTEETEFRLVRISVPMLSAIVTTSISGSYQASDWMKAQQLAYSLSKREMFIQVHMKPGDRFKMVQKGGTYLHPHYPVTMVNLVQDQEHGEVNVYWTEQDELTLRTETSYIGKTVDQYEDAYFATKTTLGIADGVSAWRKRGIDAGLFARNLLHNCEKISSKANSSADPGTSCSSLRHMLESALSQTNAVGSCTVLLAHLERNQLKVLNLGDSQAMVIRWEDGEPMVLLKTEPQTHSFNTPFQVAKLPRALPDAFIQDKVAAAVEYTVSVEPGDLILLGTDGIWDNLFEEDILAIVKQKKNSVLAELAETISGEAYEKSISNGISPFGLMTSKCSKGRFIWTGGKPDDITVVVSTVGRTCECYFLDRFRTVKH